MKTFFKVAALLMAGAMATPTLAADWEAAKGDRWTGAYIGAYGVGGVVDPDGFNIGGGGQVGYDIQFGNWVVGAVADGSISYLETEIWGYTFDGSLSQVSGRGRAGYSFGNALVYGTGGIGYTKMELEGFSVDDTSWVAGAGLEWMLTDSVSVVSETLYWDSLDGFQTKFGFNVKF